MTRRHGLAATYNAGCRCTDCSAARREYDLGRYGRIKAGKPGRRPVPLHPHGDARRYWRGCRCDDCRTAASTYQRRRAAEQRAAARARVESQILSDALAALDARAQQLAPAAGGRSLTASHARARRGEVLDMIRMIEDALTTEAAA